jgi:periplasmic protein TonB
MKTTDTALKYAVYAETFEDIIFEGRNQKYGAYALRKNYSKDASFSLLAALLFVAIICGIAFYKSIHKPPTPKKPDTGILIPVSPDDFDYTIPKPASPDVIKPEPRVENGGPWEVVDKEVDNADIAPQADLADQPAPTAPDAGTLVIADPTPDDNAIDSKDRIYEVYEIKEQASFNDGTVEDFRKWLGKHISYPEVAAINEIKGSVFVKFAVGKDGKICNVVVEKGIHPLIDQAVVKALLSSPVWKPAKLNGMPVTVFYHVPVKFELQQ